MFSSAPPSNLPPKKASAAGFTPLAQTDYLIGCEYNPTEDSLYLLAGSSEGAAGAFRLEARAGALGETGKPL